MQTHLVRSERTCEEWHNIFRHADTKVIEDMARTNCVTGMKIVQVPRRPEEGCGSCHCSGKGKRASHPSSTRERASEVLERLHMDLVGPINLPSVGGKVYFMLVRDEFSTFIFVELLASKAEVAEKLKSLIDRTYAITQRRIKFIRSDQGSEFNNITVNQMCQIYGIVSEFSAVYTPQQNGEAERANQTIIGTARSNLQAAGLPLKLWAEAVNCSAYIRNRVPNTHTNGRTPFELFYGHKPDVSHMLCFGQPVHIIDYTRSKGKFSSKTREAFMVGYGCRCMLTNLEDVVITADCVPATHSKRETIEESQTLVSFTIGMPFSAPSSDQRREASEQAGLPAPPLLSPQSSISDSLSSGERAQNET